MAGEWFAEGFDQAGHQAAARGPEALGRTGPRTDVPGRGGGGAAARKRRVAWLATALSLGFVLLGTGAVFAGAASVSGEKPVPPAPVPSVTQAPPRAVPTAIPAPAIVHTCSVADRAADARLGDLHGYVMDAGSGEVLFDQQGSVPAAPAGVLKVLTAAAALEALGPDFRLTTRVVEGVAPGSIVLVGGGDATLSRLPAGQASFYPSAPKIGDLAAQTIQAWSAAHPDVQIDKVILDATYWDPADRWEPSWDRSAISGGYQAEVTALQVDGDRNDPRVGRSPRSTDPVGRAGDAFMAALRFADTASVIADEVTIDTGSATGSTAELASVSSQPVRKLVPQMLELNDNTLAEMLARVVSKAQGLDGSSGSLSNAIPGALTGLGLDGHDLVVRDGSGLSDRNAVRPEYVAKLMAAAMKGEGSLEILYDALSVAGSGAMADRFSGDNAIARGNVTAQPGSIDSARTLAGIVSAEDGSALAFGFYAIGEVESDAEPAIDTLTTAVFRCGDNLASF